MMDIPVKIDPKLYAFLRDLLGSGKASHEGLSLDMTDVQRMTLTGSKLLFNPPIKLQVKRGIFKIATTITSMQNAKNGIHINVDNSPIDIEVRPSA